VASSPPNRFATFALAFLLVALGLATCAKCQQPHKAADSAAVATAKFLAFADSQWQYDLACTGLTPQPGGNLSDVKWQIISHDWLFEGHSFLLGLWIPPDTIRLDSAYAADAWIVRHELLHHLLRGPPPDQGGPHPWAPFAFPCQVMPFQHAAGGLMGAHS